jgi:hypothetical protein
MVPHPFSFCVRLFAQFPDWGTPHLASKAEQKALELHTAIARLYDDRRLIATVSG